MVYSGAYALVLVLHLLTALFVVGPSVVAGLGSARHARSGEAGALRAAMRTTRLYGVATIVVVVLGTGMVGLGDVGGEWDFSQAWISASYALWFIAVALTLVVVVPAQASALEALDSGEAAAALAARITVGAGLSALAYAAIVALMVLKPGV